MSRRKITDAQRDPRKSCDLGHLPFGKKPVGDSALIENFDRARMQTAGAPAGQVLPGAPLDNGNVDVRQCQLARQHQAGRARAHNDHMHPPIMPHGPGLAASPHAWCIMKVKEARAAHRRRDRCVSIMRERCPA